MPRNVSPMARRMQLRELLVGVEGLALLRHLYDGSELDAEQRIDEVRRLVDDDTFSSVETVTEADARDGYAAWAENYDEPGNPIIAIEQPVVWRMVESRARGRALDVACGTGRHTRRLVELGHSVVGVDYTPAMLRRARASVDGAEFVDADLRSLPFANASFDLVVCGLAIAHVAELDVAAVELARVLRPRGDLVMSALHPFQAHLGWHAPFESSSGDRGFVREHPHSHADYFRAFQRAGLTMWACEEPELSVDDVRSKRRAFRHVPDATVAAFAGLPGVVIWAVSKP
jgi:SAM-dependent methyltransferase